MADDAVERARGKFNSRGEPKLSAQVRQPVTWPTPTVTDSTREDARTGVPPHVLESETPVAGHNLGLNRAVKLWPTPRSRGLLGGSASREMVVRMVDAGEVDAEEAQAMLGVKLWPTPRSTDGAHGGRVTPRKSREWGNLIEAVSHRRMWLTPSANEDAAGRTTGQMQQMLTHQAKASDPDGTAAGGQLNPDWVELLMGWPLGWTRLAPLDPAVFDAWLDAFHLGWAVEAWQDGTWEEGVPRVAVKTPHRVPRLTGLGNGQVPLVVSVTWGLIGARAAR